MKTRRLYTQNVYLSATQSKIVDIKGEDIALDESVFFPTGGGQSCDLGIFNTSKSQALPVSNVYTKDGIVWHTVVNHDFSIGDTVSSSIDWQRRFDNMQRHCGEHLMSGVIFNKYQGVNKGFHMGEKYMTLDVNLDTSTFDEFTWDMALDVENCVNQIIWEDIPIVTEFIEKKESLLSYPLRKEVSASDDISIVIIGDMTNPVDCVPCCGTHPSTSGQIGLVKVYKVEKNKGMFRIYFEAGKRAMTDYQLKHDIISVLSNRYSATPESLLENIDLQEKKYCLLKESYDKIRGTLIDLRVSDIESELKSQQSIVSFAYEDMNPDDIINIGKRVSPYIQKLLIVSELNSNTILLFSNGVIDCGTIVKETISSHGGRGGGNKLMARGIFPSEDQLNTFLTEIKKQCESI